VPEVVVLLVVAAATALATGIGAVPVFLFGERAERFTPFLLGFAAGVMGVGWNAPRAYANRLTSWNGRAAYPDADAPSAQPWHGATTRLAGAVATIAAVVVGTLIVTRLSRWRRLLR
jgi:hypothetical protein